MKPVTPATIVAYLNKHGVDFSDVTRNNVRGKMKPLQHWTRRRAGGNIPKFTIANGYSKSALIFEGLDFVIKIPFATDCGYTFHGANNNDNDWDYCQREAELYVAAVEAGVSDFLAKTECVGYVDGFPIYAQERVEVTPDYRYWSERTRTRTTKKTREQARRLYYARTSGDSGFTSTDAELLILNFGFRAAQRFMNFCAKHDLGDWHSGNYGKHLTLGTVVFCDYTGYNS
jgi:hypothetical protein